MIHVKRLFIAAVLVLYLGSLAIILHAYLHRHDNDLPIYTGTTVSMLEEKKDLLDAVAQMLLGKQEAFASIRDYDECITSEIFEKKYLGSHFYQTYFSEEERQLLAKAIDEVYLQQVCYMWPAIGGPALEFELRCSDRSSSQLVYFRPEEGTPANKRAEQLKAMREYYARFACHLYEEVHFDPTSFPYWYEVRELNPKFKPPWKE